MDYDVEYDSILDCFTLAYEGEVICLGSQTYAEARYEAEAVIRGWK